VDEVSTSDGYSCRWGRNGEVCVAVAPVTRSVLLAYSSSWIKALAVNGADNSADLGCVLV